MLESEILDGGDRGIQLEGGEWIGVAFELRGEGLDVVEVDVGVPQGVDEAARLEVAHLRDHARQQSVRRDVEGHPEAHVAAALVHQARELAIGHEELAEHVAGREGHQVQIGWVPCAHDDAPIRGVVLDLVDTIGQLIESLVLIICFRINIFCTKMPPLKS